MPQPSKILVISLTRMGDIIQSIPFFRRLRLKNPNAEIHVLVESCFADVAGMIPGMDKLHTVRLEDLLPDLGSDSSNLAHALDFYLNFVQSLRAEGFDEVWNLTHTRPSMILNFLLAAQNGKGVTLEPDGLQRVNSPWMTYFFATNLVRPWCQFNLVDIYANCVDGVEWQVGRELSLQLPASAQGQTSGSSWVAIHAGASHKSKQWPISQYRQVAQQLSLHKNVELVLIGGKGDAGLGQAFHGIPRVHNLIGKTTVPQLTQLLSRCSLILTNDSGPMHIAAAVGTKVLDITVGSALACETAPYGEGHLVLEPDSECFPCSPHSICPRQHCAARISTDAVASLAEWQLGLRGAPAPDDLAGCRVYRTQFSAQDGLLELKRLFSPATHPRDELNALMRPLWLSALEGRTCAMAGTARKLPRDLGEAAQQSYDLAQQVEDLVAQLRQSVSSHNVEQVQRFAAALQSQEEHLRSSLSRHGLLRSILAYTDISRASIGRGTLDEQTNSTEQIYRMLTAMLSNMLPPETNNKYENINITQPFEDAHENPVERS